MLIKNELDPAEDSLGPTDSLIYLKLERTHLWAQQGTAQNQELFTRCVCFRVSELMVCVPSTQVVLLCLTEICCCKRSQGLNWSCALKPKTCCALLCRFTGGASAGNKVVHTHVCKCGGRETRFRLAQTV